MNKIIGKSSLKARQIDEDLTRKLSSESDLRKPFCKKGIPKNYLALSSAEKKNCHCRFFCSKKTAHQHASLLQKKTPTSTPPFLLKKENRSMPPQIRFYNKNLQAVTLMGLSIKNGLLKIGLDPHYNLPLQPNIKGDYTLTSQLESMPADPAQSFSFSLVKTFVIISEGLKSV